MTADEIEKIEIPCIRCGACCKWEGEVKVTPEEITRIAAYLRMREELFIEEKTQLSVNRKYLVIRMLNDGSCVFLHENECTINSVKPQQCKGYPLKWRNPDSALHCQAVRTLISLGILSPEE